MLRHEAMNTTKFEQQLIELITCGDWREFESCLSTVDDPNCYLNRVYPLCNHQHVTLLVLALNYGYVDALRAILDRFHPDLEVFNDVQLETSLGKSQFYQNVSILWIAAAKNNLELVQLLIQHGANVNYRSPKNSTALHSACYHGNMQMVCYLIKHGANVNIIRCDDETSLSLSIQRGHQALVFYLVDQLQCDVNMCPNQGRSPLHYAVEQKSAVLVQFLLEHGAKNQPTKSDRMSPLMWAAEERQRNLMAMLQTHVSLLEWIEAEEIYASAFVHSLLHDTNLDDLFECFKYPLKLRLQYQLPKLRPLTTKAIFGHRQECQTLDELERLRSNVDEMIIEAFLICERLLGLDHDQYHYSLSFQARLYYRKGNYRRALDSILYEIHLHQNCYSLVLSDRLRLLPDTIARLIQQSSISVEDVCTMLDLFDQGMQQESEHFDSNLIKSLVLIRAVGEVVY